MPRTYTDRFLAWRIGDSRFPIFDGTGASTVGGRWNSPGHLIIYCSSSLALAMLEILVHSGSELPRTYRYVAIRSSEPVSIEEIGPEDVPGWRDADSAEARAFGDSWAAERRSLVLSVPSVIVPNGERNLIINQAHPEFALVQASDPLELTWYARL